MPADSPLFFFGVPDVLAIAFLIFDTWKTRKLNPIFLGGTLLLIASHIIRLTLAGTETWLRFATWLTSWA